MEGRRVGKYRVDSKKLLHFLGLPELNIIHAEMNYNTLQLEITVEGASMPLVAPGQAPTMQEQPPRVLRTLRNVHVDTITFSEEIHDDPLG